MDSPFRMPRLATRKILLTTLATVCAFSMYASVKTMKISEALKGKIVKLDGINTEGRYTGYALKLQAKTIKKEKDTLQLLVDVGMIMTPDDTTYQPMVLAGGDTLLVEPNKTGSIQVAIFCGNAPYHGPSRNLHYSFLRVGGQDLVAVLKVINRHKVYNSLGQHAVWVITNQHPVNGVYDKTLDAVSKELIDELCRVTGAPKPQYFTMVDNVEVSGRPAYSPKTTEIIAEFKPKLRGATILSVGVFDEKGYCLEKLIDRKLFPQGSPTISTAFDPRPYGPGKYTLMLTSAEGTLEEKKVVAHE